MTILVDPLFDPWKVSEEATRRGHAKKRWCHMVSDEILEELHAFAKRLGLRRSWFQGGRDPHYDLTEGKRRQAVRLGAKEVTYREMFAAWEKLNEDLYGRGGC